ncbi:MAG: hypothetical protein ABI592_14550 [Acidobacteriota bacterium]
MTFPSIALLAAGLAALAAAPRLLVRRRQDRMARARMEAEGEACRLLTRADLVSGAYRRVPGVLGLCEDRLSFDGLFGESVRIPTGRIQKIVTGSKLASGRRLFRLEVLRIAPAGGEDVEFVLSPASAGAWRSHLGLWAMGERMREAAAAESVSPGRG